MDERLSVIPQRMGVSFTFYLRTSLEQSFDGAADGRSDQVCTHCTPQLKGRESLVKKETITQTGSLYGTEDFVVYGSLNPIGSVI